MRTTQADIRARDRRHADEVIGAGKERREGRGKGNLVAHAHTYSRCDELLFRYILLKEAVRVSLRELLGIGGVADLTIQSDNIGIGCTQRLQRVTVGFARGYGLFAIILWQLQR